MAKFTLIAFIVFFFPFAVSSQITITGNTNICLGDTAVLTATPAGNSYGTTNYVFETIDFNTHPPFSLGTVVDPDFQCTYVSPSGHDDCYAPLNGTIPPYGYPIGFSFCFFNQQYDHFWVGSNGWIGFTNPTGQNWTTYVADTIPNTAPNVPKNCIFAPWQDWFPGSNESGNDVYYYTLGTAPDRKLIVYWKNCPLFLCQQGAQGTYMIVLNEQSSIIENFIQNKPQCPSSTEGATQGVQNLAGTVGYTATGRNYKVWTASNEGTRFKPSGITWYKNFYPGGPQVGYGEILKIAPAATTTYFAVVGNCDGTIASNSVVVTVNTRPAPTFVSGATTACQNDVKTYTTQAGGNNYSWLYTGLWVAGGGPNDDYVTIQWGTAGSNTVSVNYNNAAGCRAVNPTILNVTVNQFEAPVLTTSANQYCADQTLTFTTQAGKSSYIWTYPLPGATLISGGTSTDNTLVVKWSTPGLKTVTVNYTDAGCTGDPPASKQVTIIGLPLVNGPFSTTICSGTNTAIMLTSTPAGAVFGWNSPPPGCSANIASCPAGVASGTLISDILTLTDNNIGTVTYHITPTLSGCPGPPQNLAVNVAPIPTVNPVTNQVACHNTATSLVQFSGNVPGTLYSWTNSNTSIGLPASGSGDIASFTATNITNSPVTATIVVSPSTTTAGATCTGTTTSFTITVNPVPAVDPLANQVLCHLVSSAAISFSGNVTGTIYNWTNSNPSIGLAAGGSGNIASFTATNPGTAPQTATITVTPAYTGSGNTCTGIPASFTITVNPLPVVNSILNQVLCHNTATELVQFSGPVPGTVYNWTNSNASIGLASSGSGDIASFTATNLTYVPVTATINVTPEFTNAGVTCTGTSSFFTVTVNPIPAVDPTANQVLCHQNPSAAVNFSGSVQGTVYNWTNSNTSVGLAASGSGNIPSFTATNTGTTPQSATITVTPAFTSSGTTCTGLPVTFSITVNPGPVVVPVVNQIMCNNTLTMPVQFSGNVPGTLYNWTNSNTSIGLAAVGSGDIPSFTATNLTNGPTTATITVTPVFTSSGLSCSGAFTSFTVTVNPVPAVNVVPDQVWCHLNSTAPVLFSGSVPGTTFTWSNSNPSIGLAGNGFGNIAPFTGLNTGTTPQTATITVTPSYSSSGVQCSGPHSSFTITINPIPTVNATVNQVLCQNTLATPVQFSGNVPGTTYSWTNSNTAIGLASGGSGDISAFTATNSSTFPITANISVTPSYTFSGQTCTGSATSFSIIVNPLPTVNGTANQVLCHLNSTAAIAFSGTVPGTVYNWVNSNTSIGLGPSGAGNISAFTATNSTASPVTATIAVTPSFTNANVSCTGAVSVFTYTVNPLPQPIISGPASVCLNIPSTDTTEIFQSGYTWNIVSGGIITSGQTTNKVNVLWNTLGIHSITVNYTDQHGCTALVPASKQVTVSALPSPAIAGAATVCAGDTKTYKTLAGASSYTWGVPSSGINVISGGGVADDSVTIQWNTSGTYNISVNYVISSGCTAASPSNYSVTVNALPFPQITGPAPVCAFSTHNYTVSPIIGGHFYNWTVSGGTILSGQNAGTVQVSWGNSSPGSLGLTETINYPGISCPASAVPFPVVLNPWPGAAGSITGQNSVCKTSAYAYSVPAITNATTIQWQYTGSGVTIANNGNATITITFTSTATSGALTVHGINNCGNGPVSQPLNIAVHELPGVSLTPCFDLVTTTNAKKIVLRGGTPWLSGQGVYSGNRVNLNALTGFYEFDPTGATAGSYSITYTYTNTYGCIAAASVSMTIQNNPFTCGGTLTDVRDSKTYKTAYLSNRCWMAENLSHGTTLVSPGPVQTDNCIIEKYCSPGDAGCTLNGGKYQWDELMDYIATPGTKGICPPEWHVPTEAEWQSLIDNLVTGTGAPDANALSASSLKDVLLLNGFQALFGGLNYQDYQWAFSAGTLTGSMFWTSTPNGNTQSIARGLNNYTPSISRYSSVRSNAFPVRCIKD